MEIPGREGDVDPFYKNMLDKSIAERWWTKLFSDAFKDDSNVVSRILNAEFPNLFNDNFPTIKKVNTYTTTCLSLKSEVHNSGGHHLETSGNSPYSVYTVDRGLYRISESMVDILEQYFDEICNLRCFKDDTFKP